MSTETNRNTISVTRVLSVSIDHAASQILGPDVLMSRLARHVNDKRLLKLIGCYLRAGVLVKGVLQPTEVGSPQDGPLSRLSSNIPLDDLDKELERRGLPFVRDADDCAVFANSPRAAARIMTSVSRFLTKTLRLVVNKEKSRVVTSDEFEYLGFSFVKSRATIKVSLKSLQKFKRRIVEITGLSRGISMNRRLAELRRYVHGSRGLLRRGSPIEVVRSVGRLDSSADSVLLLETVASSENPPS